MARTPISVSISSSPVRAYCSDRFAGYKFFEESYIPDLCAAHCTATSKYNREHPDENGEYLECNFFVAYIMYEDGKAKGLHCTMYSREYDVRVPSMYVGSILTLADFVRYQQWQ